MTVWRKYCVSFPRCRLHERKRFFGRQQRYVYLFLDGVSLRVRRPSGRKRCRCWWPTEYVKTKSALAGLLAQPGRKSGRLGGAARRSVPPRTRRTPAGPDSHRWLCRPGGGDSHRLSARAASALLGAQGAEYFREARKRDYDEVKAGAQAIYLAEGRAQAVATFRVFRSRWYRAYPAMVRRLQQDLPELLSFFAFPGTCGANCAPPT